MVHLVNYADKLSANTPLRSLVTVLKHLRNSFTSSLATVRAWVFMSMVAMVTLTSTVGRTILYFLIPCAFTLTQWLEVFNFNLKVKVQMVLTNVFVLYCVYYLGMATNWQLVSVQNMLTQLFIMWISGSAYINRPGIPLT